MFDSKPDYEYDLDPEAENNTAAAVFRMAAAGGERVLDLGSGPGIVAAALAEAGRTVTCLDSEQEYLDAARERGVERTVRADLNSDRWVEDLDGETFDVIIVADVLEHLYEPGSVLDAILEHELLSDDGYLVVSVPNVSHEAVIASLAGGRFDYTQTGLLDATHIRFFTRETFQRLCEEHGYVVTRLERTIRTIEQTELFHTAEQLGRQFREQLADRSLDARTYQYIMQIEPADIAHELARLRHEADEQSKRRVREVEDARTRFRLEREEVEAQLRAEKEELQEELGAVQAERQALESRLASAKEEMEELATRAEQERGSREELVSELRDARDTLEEDRTRFEAELGDLRRRYEEQFDARQRHREEAERLRQKLDEVYASETWRVGRAIMWLPRRLKLAARTEPSSDDDQEAERAPRPHVPARLRPTYELEEATDLRAEYESALNRRSFRDPVRTHVAVTVSTRDLDEGRGDVFTAIGLGRYLERIGYECVYLEPDEWYDVPDGTDVYLSLLAEPRFMLDPTRVPDDCLLIAWARNNTERWLRSRTLQLYDGLLCSSERTRRTLERRHKGPLSILRIGVDAELFDVDPEGARSGVAATVNQWGGTRDTYAALAQLEVDFPLTIHGVQRGLPASLEPFSHGPVTYFEIPSLYEQVAIVLDDQQDVNRPYGNVNSRIFETLAAGALPVTANANGLSEVGLERVPTYGSPQELRSIVHRYLENDEERSALIEDLRERVISEHTHAHRAEQLDAFVRDLRDRQHTSGWRLVAFYPDYTATNPYQDLLYSEIGEVEAVAAPLDVGELQRAVRPSREDRLFHLHWTATILGPAASPREAQARKDGFLTEIDQLCGSGTRFIWTIHNALPHECEFPDVEIDLRKGLAERADAIHVMCESTIDEVASLYRLPRDRVRVIAHGSYLDVYPNIISEDRARSELGLESEERVLLFFGQIRPYKGLDRLLDAFVTARRDRPDLRLVVAGSPGRFEGVRELLARCQRTEGVIARFEEVPDVDVQRYFNASDVVVLPHRRVLNSGGVMLAFSFGRPVVAPRTGCLPELVKSDVGTLFEPDGNDLARVLAGVDSICGPSHRAAAFEIAAANTYVAMSEEFGQVIDEIS